MDKKEAKQKAKGLLDEYIETNKCRKTPERYVILDAVSSMRDPFTLEDLDRKLSGELRFPVSRATLYNTMNLFVKKHFIGIKNKNSYFPQLCPRIFFGLIIYLI